MLRLPDLVELRASRTVREEDLPPNLPNQNVQTSAVRLDSPLLDPDLWETLLSPDELRRSERFLVESARRQFVGARGVLRLLLAEQLKINPRELRFCYDEKGKPRLCNG